MKKFLIPMLFVFALSAKEANSTPVIYGPYYYHTYYDHFGKIVGCDVNFSVYNAPGAVSYQWLSMPGFKKGLIEVVSGQGTSELVVNAALMVDIQMFVKITYSNGTTETVSTTVYWLPYPI